MPQPNSATAAGGTAVRDVLVKEIRAAVAQIAPTLPAGQRMLIQTACAGVGAMPEPMARKLAVEIVSLGDQLRGVLAGVGVVVAAPGAGA